MANGEKRTQALDGDRLAVATFVLLLLGASFLVLLVEFATAFVLPAAVVYGLLAVVLLWRVLTKGRTAPREKR